MNLLLDTHIYLWLNQAPEKIPLDIMVLCENTKNTLFLSYVSIWEIEIKYKVGKLSLKTPLQIMLDQQQFEDDFQFLPIKLEHLYYLKNLPSHHRDPERG